MRRSTRSLIGVYSKDHLNRDAANDAEKLSEEEEAHFKRAAKHVLELSEELLAEMIAKEQFVEVIHRD